ncbi:unnamed protein product [Timema podura]|uniref:Ionotropic glutamate receptor C-terminal domain-containing protein n=1 Tax=Timema podura TaxID=61482 RepID=A0ABN7P6H0_TIMPD|nr:unnamed protein product [Timema podura]
MTLIPVLIVCVQSETPSSCRVAVFGTYLMVVTVLAAYSGQLTSVLTVLRYQLPFTSFQEFLERGTYTLELQRHSATNKHFLESNVSSMKTIFSSQIMPKMSSLPHSVKEGLVNLCWKERYAWMTTRSAVESMNEALNCSLDVIPGACYRSTNTIALPKNSPYKAIINYNIQMLRRFGILNKLYQDEFPVTFPRIEDREVEGYRTLQRDSSIGDSLCRDDISDDVPLH